MLASKISNTTYRIGSKAKSTNICMNTTYIFRLVLNINCILEIVFKNTSSPWSLFSFYYLEKKKGKQKKRKNQNKKEKEKDNW